MLWGEPQICAGYHAVTEKEPLPVEVCPSPLKTLLDWGEKVGNLLLIIIRMS